jgi:hypothetical protein
MDFHEMKPQLKNEITSAIGIWKELIIDFHGDNLSYIYAKGSAIKDWDSLIDYVPILGDIDIHYGIHDKAKLFDDNNLRKASLKVTLEYENRFNKDNPDKLHIPRSQIMCTDNLQGVIPFVHPLSTSVEMLFGEFPDHPQLPDDQIREIDMNNLLDLEPYLAVLPDSYFDKVGLDYWSSLRQLNWRVSPSPVRILTQLLSDPMNVWTWNRTKIKIELEAFNLNDLVNIYEEYYLNGWELFKSNITSTKYFQRCLLTGSNLIEMCYNWYLNRISNNSK